MSEGDPPETPATRPGPTPGTAFPRSARLLRPADFSRALSQATVRLRRGPLSLAAVPNGGGGARLGLVVGKRYVRRAVQRNRIKRVIRESYRRHRAGLPSVDVAILLKRGSAPETDNSNLIRCLDELWKQLVARHHRATG